MTEVLGTYSDCVNLRLSSSTRSNPPVSYTCDPTYRLEAGFVCTRKPSKFLYRRLGLGL